jgi:hypothetical protein
MTYLFESLSNLRICKVNFIGKINISDVFPDFSEGKYWLCKPPLEIRP